MFQGTSICLPVPWLLHCRYNPGVGLVSLTDLASDMLLSQGVSHKSQNQNAGFSGWFVLAVALQHSLQFRRELVKYNVRYVRRLCHEHATGVGSL